MHETASTEPDTAAAVVHPGIYDVADDVTDYLLSTYRADTTGSARPEPLAWPEWMTTSDYQAVARVLAWRAVEGTLDATTGSATR